MLESVKFSLLNGLIEAARHGSARCRERLGGLLNYYYREAA